ncbi:hypothetical protein ACKLNR_005334 [Fusarium oxysporum f. sp. zingiberi]
MIGLVSHGQAAYPEHSTYALYAAVNIAGLRASSSGFWRCGCGRPGETRAVTTPPRTTPFTYIYLVEQLYVMNCDTKMHAGTI